MLYFWPDYFYNEFKFYSNIKLKLPMDFKKIFIKIRVYNKQFDLYKIRNIELIVKNVNSPKNTEIFINIDNLP